MARNDQPPIKLADATKLDPYRRWHLIADFLRLIYVSSRISNIEAPLNCILVGPPGDGKTKMILRGEHVKHVKVLSDMTYMGVCTYLRTAKEGVMSTIVVPDLGTLVGRKLDTGKQTISVLAMMCAEGVQEIAVGKRIVNYEGVTSSVISAVTPEDLTRDYQVFNQNAFLSRVFLLDFDLSINEILAMMHRKSRGDRTLLTPFKFPRLAHADAALPTKSIKLPRRHAIKAIHWYEELVARRPDRAFGFRSADALQGLLMASAYLRGSYMVSERDVAFVTTFKPLWLRQFRMASQK